MKFIILQTASFNRDVYVNPAAIVTLTLHTDRVTLVALSGVAEALEVKNSPESILGKIKSVEEGF